VAGGVNCGVTVGGPPVQGVGNASCLGRLCIRVCASYKSVVGNLMHSLCKVDYVVALARTAPERPSVDLPLCPFDFIPGPGHIRQPGFGRITVRPTCPELAIKPRCI